MEHLSNLERWKYNQPARTQRRRHEGWGLLGAVMMLAAAAIVVLCATIGRAADARPTQRPELVIFSMPGCRPCGQLRQDVAAGGISGYDITWAGRQDPLYDEFATAVPTTDADLNPGYIGPVNARPAQGLLVPAVWIRGTSHYWSGYHPGQLERLRRYLSDYYPRPQTQAPTAPALEPQPSALDNFDGVHVIVAVSQLSQQARELRAAVARRADLALQELSRTHLGSKVQAAFVAEVADADRYARLVAAAGMSPTADNPFACYVLIPEKFSGYKGWLLGQVETALAEHFLVPLQQAHVSVILERIHGGTYEAVLEALAGNGPVPASPAPPVDPVPFALSAWISERSDLMRRLFGYFGLA